MSTQKQADEGGTPDPQYAPVPREHQARVASLVETKRSLSHVAGMLKLSELTVSKLIGGQKVSRAMRALIAQTLSERDAAGKKP